MSFIYFLFGGLCGMVCMSLFAARSYEKGFEDAKRFGSGEFVLCDDCQSRINTLEGEDFFVETPDGSYVFCEQCWQRYERGVNRG